MILQTKLFNHTEEMGLPPNTRTMSSSIFLSLPMIKKIRIQNGNDSFSTIMKITTCW